jgi:hypothetical protein
VINVIDAALIEIVDGMSPVCGAVRGAGDPFSVRFSVAILPLAA